MVKFNSHFGGIFFVEIKGISSYQAQEYLSKTNSKHNNSEIRVSPLK